MRIVWGDFRRVLWKKVFVFFVFFSWRRWSSSKTRAGPKRTPRPAEDHAKTSRHLLSGSGRTLVTCPRNRRRPDWPRAKRKRKSGRRRRALKVFFIRSTHPPGRPVGPHVREFVRRRRLCRWYHWISLVYRVRTVFDRGDDTRSVPSVSVSVRSEKLSTYYTGRRNHRSWTRR